MTKQQYRFTSPSGAFNFTGPEILEMREIARDLMNAKFGRHNWEEPYPGMFTSDRSKLAVDIHIVPAYETHQEQIKQTAAPKTKNVRLWFKSGYHEDYTMMADGDIVITNQGWLIFIDVHKNKVRIPPHIVENITSIVEGNLYDEPTSPEKIPIGVAKAKTDALKLWAKQAHGVEIAWIKFWDKVSFGGYSMEGVAFAGTLNYQDYLNENWSAMDNAVPPEHNMGKNSVRFDHG